MKPTDAISRLFNKREIQIMRLICRQWSTKEIAEKFELSSRTIEDNRQVILRKTKSKRTAGIVIYAIRHRIYLI